MMATKVKCKRRDYWINLWQNSQCLWNIVFSRRSIWVLLELIGRWTWHFTKSTRRHIKLDKFIGTQWLPYLLCKHWFASSLWNFCHWVADVPPCETSPAVKSARRYGLFHRQGRHWKIKDHCDCSQLFTTIALCNLSPLALMPPVSLK